MLEQTSLTVEAGDVTGDEERELLAALERELITRYRGTPGETYAEVDPTHARDFTEPQGTFLVARASGSAVGCGGIRRVDDTTAEIKRMYVLPQARNAGVARTMLAALERWARDRHLQRIILESGSAQPDACALYESSGYQRIQPYGVWKNSPQSICYEKRLVS